MRNKNSHLSQIRSMNKLIFSQTQTLPLHKQASLHLGLALHLPLLSSFIFSFPSLPSSSHRLLFLSHFPSLVFLMAFKIRKSSELAPKVKFSQIFWYFSDAHLRLSLVQRVQGYKMFLTASRVWNIMCVCVCTRACEFDICCW